MLLISLPSPFILLFFLNPLLLYFSSCLFVLFARGVGCGCVSTLQSASVVILARLKLAQGSVARGWSKGLRAAVPTPLNPFRGHPAAMYGPSLGGSPSPHPRSPDGVGWRCEEQFSRNS